MAFGWSAKKSRSHFGFADKENSLLLGGSFVRKPAYKLCCRYETQIILLH